MRTGDSRDPIQVEQIEQEIKKLQIGKEPYEMKIDKLEDRIDELEEEKMEIENKITRHFDNNTDNLKEEYKSLTGEEWWDIDSCPHINTMKALDGVQRCRKCKKEINN